MEIILAKNPGEETIILISDSEKVTLDNIVEKYGDICTNEDVLEILAEDGGGLGVLVEQLRTLRYPDAYIKELGLEVNESDVGKLKAFGILIEDIVKKPLHKAEDMEEFLQTINADNIPLFEFKPFNVKIPEPSGGSIKK